MSSNKKIKDELIRRYGNKCFIERLHLRDTKNTRYRGCNQYKRMKQLTYHHIKMRKDGGKATVENGALLSAENHQWFHKQPKEAQDTMNDMFQELKRKIDYEKAKIEFVEEVECPFNINCAEIWYDGRELHSTSKKQVKTKQKRKEKTEMQRIKKEWEDR